MYVETHTIVTFVLPDEFREAERFREKNDMTEWKESLSTVAISFMRKQYYKAEYKSGCGEEQKEVDDGSLHLC